MSRRCSPLAVDRVGDGIEPVVLLHGFLGSGRNLRGLAQHWRQAAPRHGFWLVDLPGHGQSPPFGEHATLDTLAATVHEAVELLALGRRFRVVGHSLGGRVALAWLRVAAPGITDITLLDIGPDPVPPASTDSQRVLDILLRAPDEAPDRRGLRTFLVDSGLSQATADWVLMNLAFEQGSYRWRVDRAALARLHTRVSSEDLWPVVEHAAVPLRCIRGSCSRYVSDATSARLLELGCAVDTIEGAGHDLHVDAPDEVVRLLG